MSGRALPIQTWPHAIQESFPPAMAFALRITGYRIDQPIELEKRLLDVVSRGGDGTRASARRGQGLHASNNQAN